MFLQNTPPDNNFLSLHGNDGLIVKARAQMMAAVACSKVCDVRMVNLIETLEVTNHGNSC